MRRRLLLIRGGAMSKFSGLGKAFHDLKQVLQNDEVDGWTYAGTLEYESTSKMTAFQRLRKRWTIHPKTVKNSLKNSTDVDAALITDQEQAHLVPKQSSIPVGVYVHDFFHLFPTQENFPEGEVTIGQAKPGFVRKRDISKLKKGLQRADFILCNTEYTRQLCSLYLPKKPLHVIAYHVNSKEYEFSETANEYPTEFDATKCNLLVVGSHEPRKRLNFIVDVMKELDDHVKQDILVHHVGSNYCHERNHTIDHYASQAGVVWKHYGQGVDDAQLNRMRWNAERLLFPSAAEGFGYPPLEACLSGLPVLCSDQPAHNEFIPNEMCIDARDSSLWKEHITEIHSVWKQRNGPRQPFDFEAGTFQKFNKSHYCNTFSEVLNSVFEN